MMCDSDSLYFTLAHKSIDACVKPDLLEKWHENKGKFFSSNDTSPIEFEGKNVPFNQYDKRTPGKYKAEFEGQEMICLNSKCYHIWGFNAKGKFISKTSAKGSNARNILTKTEFLNTLTTQKPHQVVNAGFVRDGLDIKTYTQQKTGFSYFYGKRKVLADGVSTIHLDI